MSTELELDTEPNHIRSHEMCLGYEARKAYGIAGPLYSMYVLVHTIVGIVHG